MWMFLPLHVALLHVCPLQDEQCAPVKLSLFFYYCAVLAGFVHSACFTTSWNGLLF